MNDAFSTPESVLVLGGSSDLARSTLIALVERGTRRIALAGRSRANMEPVGRELLALGASEVHYLDFDARIAQSCISVVDEAAQTLGRIDLTLIAFGVLGDQAANKQDPLATADLLHVNTVAPIVCLTRLSQLISAQGQGNVVVFSSVAAERARRSNYIYGASKAGLDAFCQGLMLSLPDEGGRLMIVRPGFVPTSMTAGRQPPPLFSTTPEVVAAEVVRGLERQMAVVFAPRRLKWLMSILRHLPLVVWRRVPF
jgi:decaprenylphospho-beta-D-erythro-pentofuranosid-2-ulose 2-reductase